MSVVNWVFICYSYIFFSLRGQTRVFARFVLRRQLLAQYLLLLALFQIFVIENLQFLHGDVSGDVSAVYTDHE